MSQIQICPKCGEVGATSGGCKGPRPVEGAARTCEMEMIFREGKCGKPASGYWLHLDGTDTAVCDICALSVMVNGGKLEQKPQNDED